MSERNYLSTRFELVKYEEEEEEERHEKVENEKDPNINLRQFFGLLLGLLHYVAAGIVSGWASVIMAQIENSTITKSEASWIVSIVVVPMAPAAFLCGLLLNKLPRKTVLITITIIEIIGWIVIYASTSVRFILIGRAVSGSVSAMGSPIIPPFLGEISNPNFRGFYLCMVLLGISLGLLLIHILGAIFTWNMCALLSALFLMGYLCLCIYLPETYAWHLRNSNLKKSEEAFYWYRGKNQASRQEFAKLITQQHENVINHYSKLEMLQLCFSKKMLMPLGICTVAMVTMHLSGIKVIMFYSITIISQVIPTLNQYTSTIIVDVIRIVMTCIGCLLVNRFPVRPLFIISGVGSAISHFCFAAFFSYTTTSNAEMNHAFSILALIALISYTVFSSIGIAPLAWVIAGEIFPLIVKAIASGACCFVYFMAFFIMVKITPDLFDCFGISGGFVFFGGCTIVGTVIIYFILPETKNKTLAEIEDLFR